jgi:hypothetical protein
VTLVANVFFVNGMPFLITSSRGISLITIEFLPSWTGKHLALTLEQFIRGYRVAGFIVQVALMDMEFEKLKDVLPNITINTTAAREHVGEIERKIQVIKERARGTMATLSYLTLSKIMIIKLMHFCVLWLNSFPDKSGVSEKWRLMELILHHWLDVKLHCKTSFRAYCEMHTDPDITNTMERRTKWGICMGPTGNLQGSYKFMSLTPGKKIARHKFTEMLMTEAVMKQIKKWAMKDRVQNGLTFKNRNGEEYKFNDDKNVPFPDIPVEAPGILTEQEETQGVNAIQEELIQQNEV